MPAGEAEVKVSVRFYPCRVDRVIDGDTVAVTVDHGFKVYTSQIVRLIGINAPERKTPEGIKASKFTADWVAAHSVSNGKMIEWPFTLAAMSMTDRYGRRLARVFPFGEDGTRDLSAALLASGNATEFVPQ